MTTDLIAAGAVLLLVTLLVFAGWCGLRAECRNDRRQAPEVKW
jgi:hypothetical protein